VTHFLQPPEADPETGELTEAGQVTAKQGRLTLEEARAVQAEIDAGLRELEARAVAETILERRRATVIANELERERSGVEDTWKPVGLSELFDTEPLTPEVGHFLESEKSNGGGVFYAGKVNGVYGPSESGKTMLCLMVAAQEMQAGNDVVMTDFEDDARSIVNRLRYVFGVGRETIEKHFHYFRPAEAFNERAFENITSIENVTLVIIDAVTEGMSAAGLDGRNENEVATWFNDFPKRLARTGVAVCLVDHTPHDKPDRALGSQQKKSSIDGVSYVAESVQQFVKGRKGTLRISIAKDRIGEVRIDALPGSTGGWWRGDLVIDGIASPDRPRVTLFGIDPAALAITGKPSASKDVTASVRLPSKTQEPVLMALAEDGGWMSATAIEGWINEGLPEGDERRISRQAPRKLCGQLINKSLVERKADDSPSWRVTGLGVHAANILLNQDRGDVQMEIENMGSKEGSEPIGEPIGEPMNPKT
jgi:hypothetical protein